MLVCTAVQIPGVAINSNNAITGVETVCSPPPQHRPFSLPETYMHGRDAKAVVDAKILPGEVVPCLSMAVYKLSRPGGCFLAAYGVGISSYGKSTVC